MSGAEEHIEKKAITNPLKISRYIRQGYPERSRTIHFEWLNLTVLVCVRLTEEFAKALQTIEPLISSGI
ncbi:MAG: hypothetical protein FJ190_05055 [Gammaproteobacteria bacterium]|nr:hypothetical protein [Gammaproteobacteria bacterium]